MSKEVEDARWELYWKAWADINNVSANEHPDDQHTTYRQRDFYMWLHKVLADPMWYIAPDVTAADRAEAELPTEREHG